MADTQLYSVRSSGDKSLEDRPSQEKADSDTRKKVLIIFGTRPEAIKMVPVVRRLAAHPLLEVEVCVTAQHRQMLDQVLTLFEIVPTYDLNLMRPGQTLATLTAAIMTHLPPVFEASRPDLVLVHGDTSTTFAAALTAFYHHIPVGHVEAGLRTGNMQAPWPEEANRRLTAPLCALHFAPTEQARTHLLSENIPGDQITVTGNTVIDALHMGLEKLRTIPSLKQDMHTCFPFLGKPEITSENGRRLILITGHRRENFGDGFEAICQAVNSLSIAYPEADFVYPVHLNPSVVGPVNRLLGGRSNIHLISPQDYLPFLFLMERAYLILTDSGGIQEEAPSLGKPVLVMRDTTERPEAVTHGTVKLVGTNAQVIEEAVTDLIENPELYKKMALAHNPYGDGHASERILKTVCTYLEQGKKHDA